MDRTVRIRLVDEKDRVLLVLESGGKIKKSNDYIFTKTMGWGLPGGRVKAGETPLAAAFRELQEEAGLTAEIMPEPICFSSNRHDIFLFQARCAQTEPKADGKDIIATRWFPWKMAYGTLKHEGRDYRIYESHLRLIHCEK